MCSAGAIQLIWVSVTSSVVMIPVWLGKAHVMEIGFGNVFEPASSEAVHSIWLSVPAGTTAVFG